ncbi:hypothetical protein GCM10007978_02310 [Shewanella hanedai]|uniref:Uncharacterized protein n=1 Tax=Shewanella hanedai TaxID=25 RepID=A0A553JV59_SHEHA|nr:hypothetical protein [Shewanella hanedai]TRY16334.1 hypothetical protein FN961_01545 [Shewanella hanedai]GGI68170.1 hypothetical protein GCM10007978_02310 [Shewanella hanedai]
MPNKGKFIPRADTFNRGALRMTVAMLRDVNPALALVVQNQMSGPINPQVDNNPSPRDNFRVNIVPLEVRYIIETLKTKEIHPNVDPGTQMLIKSLVIDWINYANMLIELENDKNA